METIPCHPVNKSGEPLTVETSITVGDTVIKSTDTDVNEEGNKEMPSVPNPGMDYWNGGMLHRTYLIIQHVLYSER